MACLGVLFAVDQSVVEELRAMPRAERPDFVSEGLEETMFEEHPDRVLELDKSWDAMHRLLTGGKLLFGDDAYPAGGVILGGDVLYGDEEGEDDYIITAKAPAYVRDIAAYLEQVTQQQCREGYFALDEEEYAYPLTEEDFEYTWEYLSGSVDFWKEAASRDQWMLFTVDQKIKTKRTGNFRFFS